MARFTYERFAAFCAEHGLDPAETRAVNKQGDWLHVMHVDGSVASVRVTPTVQPTP